MDVTFGVVVSQIFLSNVICSHYRVHHPRREENPYHVLVVSTGSLASRTIVLSCISGLHYNWLGRAGADDSGITFGGWPAAAAAAREAAARPPPVAEVASDGAVSSPRPRCAARPAAAPALPAAKASTHANVSPHITVWRALTPPATHGWRPLAWQRRR
jgi:hypothetical protein